MCISDLILLCTLESREVDSGTEGYEIYVFFFVSYTLRNFYIIRTDFSFHLIFLVSWDIQIIETVLFNNFSHFSRDRLLRDIVILDNKKKTFKSR